MKKSASSAGMALRDRRSSSDGAAKYVLSLSDGLSIEAMFLPSKHRRTICVSSQVGCVLDCTFCATGTMGFSRNLTTEEIVGQVELILADQEAPSASNVVFMGMGEPFYNYDNVLAAAAALSHPRGWNIAPSRITISTAGVLPRIEQMLCADLPYKLAISVTSADAVKRSRLMPINDRFPLADLRAVLERMPVRAVRRVMIEVPLLGGVNDSAQDAEALRSFCSGLPVRVNLIPWNPTDTGGSFARPDDATVLAFQKILRTEKRPVFIRRSLGLELQGACGQLVVRSGARSVPVSAS